MPPGPRCVLRTSSFDHPASCVPNVVAARPFLHSVTLVVPAGADADAADPPVRRLPPAPPYFAATAPLTSLVAPSFIEWAVPVRGQPSAVALTTPASLDGGGVAALAPDGVLRLALPGPAWRRLGANPRGPSRRSGPTTDQTTTGTASRPVRGFSRLRSAQRVPADA